MEEGKLTGVPLDTECQAINHCWESETWSSPGMSSLIIYTTPSGQPWNHWHMSDTKETQKVVLVHLCIHMLVIQTKRPSIWEGIRGDMREAGGRAHGRFWKEEREDMMWLLLLSKIRKEACLWSLSLPAATSLGQTLIYWNSTLWLLLLHLPCIVLPGELSYNSATPLSSATPFLCLSPWPWQVLCIYTTHTHSLSSSFGHCVNCISQLIAKNLAQDAYPNNTFWWIDRSGCPGKNKYPSGCWGKDISVMFFK